MIDSPPLVEVDESGTVHSSGVEVPRGLVHVATTGHIVTNPVGWLETVIEGLYSYARRMRDEN